MYVAIYKEEIVSCHKTYLGAMKSLMEYAGLTKGQIKEIINSNQDFTNLDDDARIEQSVR
jgi:hypothetical protein